MLKVIGYTHLGLRVEKSYLEDRISNENFVKNEPQEVIETTKARINELNEQIETIEELKKSL